MPRLSEPRFGVQIFASNWMHHYTWLWHAGNKSTFFSDVLWLCLPLGTAVVKQAEARLSRHTRLRLLCLAKTAQSNLTTTTVTAACERSSKSSVPWSTQCHYSGVCLELWHTHMAATAALWSISRRQCLHLLTSQSGNLYIYRNQESLSEHHPDPLTVHTLVFTLWETNVNCESELFK